MKVPAPKLLTNMFEKLLYRISYKLTAFPLTTAQSKVNFILNKRKMRFLIEQQTHRVSRNTGFGTLLGWKVQSVGMFPYVVGEGCLIHSTVVIMFGIDDQVTFFFPPVAMVLCFPTTETVVHFERILKGNKCFGAPIRGGRALR